jgi:hypothetical protein
MEALLPAAALLLAVAAQQDCTLPEVSNAAEGGVCGAAVLAAGETCEPQCAEGFAARGVCAAIGLSLLARKGLTGLSMGGRGAGAAGLLGRAGMGARVDELGALYLCCVRCWLQRQSLTAFTAAAVAEHGGGSSSLVLRCTTEGALEPAEFRCAPHVCPTLDCWSLRSRERPRLQGVCPSCWYGCLDTGHPPTDVSGTVIPNPGTCTIGCRDGFREDAALATNGSCTPHSDQMVPHHSEDCEPLRGFQPCWGGNAGGMACVPSGKPCPTAPNASYAGMATNCVASTCPAPDLGPTLKGAPLAMAAPNCVFCLALRLKHPHALVASVVQWCLAAWTAGAWEMHTVRLGAPMAIISQRRLSLVSTVRYRRHGFQLGSQAAPRWQPASAAISTEQSPATRCRWVLKGRF